MGNSPRSANEFDAAIAANLRAIRIGSGISQEALAACLGISFQQVQKYEKGTNRISAGKLAMASAILKRPIQDFFDGASALEAPPQEVASPSARCVRLAAEIERIENQAQRAALVRLVKTMAYGEDEGAHWVEPPGKAA